MRFPEEGYVSTAQVAVFLGVSTRTLEGWRSKGLGPPAYALPSGTRGRPPVRYKAEEVRQCPQIHRAGAGAIRAWVVEEGMLCGEAARLIEPAALAGAMLENEDIQAMNLMEALMLPWRSPDDLAPYAREAEGLAQGMIEQARSALSRAQLEAGTRK
jgi:hypothetical protein